MTSEAVIHLTRHVSLFHVFSARNYPNVVPSVRGLEANELQLIADALQVHQDFNLAQMLQGENVPASVLQLQEVIKRLGIEILRRSTRRPRRHAFNLSGFKCFCW